MKRVFECPKCGSTVPEDDLNELGREMLAKKGAPGCCGRKMIETWVPKVQA